jgi:excisionase family DNA binding protein
MPMTTAELPLVLTVEEVARALRVSRGSAYEAIRCGDIPSVRIGRGIRVPRHALAALLGEQSNAEGVSEGGEPPETPSHPSDME